MRKILMLMVVVGATALFNFQSKAQVSTPFNYGVAANFVGWNAAQLFPLTVAHKGNQPILFLTNNTNRMKLNQTVNYAINGVNSSRNGFLYLGGDASLSGGFVYANKGAFSLLHLNGINADGAAEEGGFRDWMKYGIFSTHNQDGMFIGQPAQCERNNRINKITKRS